MSKMLLMKEKVKKILGRSSPRKMYEEDGCFIKIQHPSYAGVEFVKTQAAQLVAGESGIFRVPTILDYIPEQGRLVFERIPGLLSIQEAFCIFDDPLELASQVGRSLAYIHEYLRLPVEFIKDIPACWTNAYTHQAFLHGDFNITNVRVEVSCRKLVILDWAFTDVWGGEGTYGSTGFDVLWFVHTLFYANSFRWHKIANLSAVASMFLESYWGGYSKPVDRHMREIYKTYFIQGADILQKHRRRRRGFWRSQIDSFRFADLKRFCENLSI